MSREMRDGYPVVRYDELTDGHNSLDNPFSVFVDLWMNSFMPGGPMGMLDTNPERWEVEPEAVHEVQAIEWPAWECTECGAKHDEEPDTPCCPEGTAESTTCTGFVLVNTYTREFVTHNCGYSRYTIDQYHDDVITYEDESDVLVWHDRHEAERMVEEADRAYDAESGHERQFGFPWAHSWWHRPDGFIKSDLLKSAGFRVGSYVGGAGDYHQDETYRLCGIDGGGYSFKEAHFTRLVALWSADGNSCTVPTQYGDAFITFDYRSELEKLADVPQEET